MRKPPALVLSLLVHGLVITALILGRSKFQSQPPPLGSRGPIAVIVESESKSKPDRGGNSRPLRRRSERTSQPQSKADLGELGLDLLAKSGSSNSVGSGSVPGGQDGFAVAESMDIHHENRLYPFIEAVWARIDAATIYPADFVKRRVTGSVLVQFEIAADGRFTGRFRSAESASPALKTYVLAMIAHALRAPLPEASRSHGEPTLLVARFDFSTFGPGEAPHPLQHRHFKNILEFRKEAYTDPLLNQKVDEFFTQYFPPIIPIPGGFFVDLVRAYQLIQNIGKPDLEKVRDNRMAGMREQWEHVIRRAKDEAEDPQPGPSASAGAPIR